MSWLGLAAVVVVAQAEEPMTEELADAETAGVLEEGLALHAQAEKLYGEGRYAEALETQRDALPLMEQAFGPNHPNVASSLSNLGFYLVKSQGDYDGARPLFERSLAIREKASGPDSPDVAHSLNNLAHLLQEQGDYGGARPLFERSLAIQEKALGPNHAAVATTLNNLAQLFTLQGDYDGARPLHERSLSIREKAVGPDHPDVATSLNNLAQLSNRQGDYDGARPLFERSLAIQEKAFGPDHPRVALALNGLAHVLQVQGDNGGARRLYERSLAIQEGVLGPDHPSIAASLNNLALLSRLQGDYDDARPLYERSLAVREKAFGPNHPKVATSLDNLARLLHERGDSDSARPLYERSLAIREARLDLLDSMSEREALAYVARSRRTLSGWLAAFARPADGERAWSTTLRWKGVVTRRVREQAPTLADPEAQALYQRLRETKSALARVTFADYDPNAVEERRAQKVELTHEKERLERQLAAASAAWRGERKVEQAGATQICAALRDGTGLIDFLYDDNKYIAFVVVAPVCEVRRVELGSADSLDDALRAWREVLAANEPRELTFRINARGEKVRKLVWEPLESPIAGADELIVVPDGALSALPFGALPSMKGGYLIGQYPIHYLENAQDLLREPVGTSTTGALLVGDVDFGGSPKAVDTDAVADLDGTRSAPCVSGDYKQLDGTVEELDALSEQWSKGRHRRETAEVLRGASASEAGVFTGMPGHRVVHLATHGFFADENCRSALAGGGEERQSVVGFNPMLLSGVVLAGANAEHDPLDAYDGILTAEELSAIDLHGTELVVLSACETGLGVVRAGEGVLGLRRAFAAAGVENLVMSLWSVPDKATSELMEGFYERVLRRRKPMTPADAMRAAQLEMLERNREDFGDSRPGSWAAFVVAGRP